MEEEVQSGSSAQLFGISAAGARGGRSASLGLGSLSLRAVQNLGARQTFQYLGIVGLSSVRHDLISVDLKPASCYLSFRLSYLKGEIMKSHAAFRAVVSSVCLFLPMLFFAANLRSQEVPAQAKQVANDYFKKTIEAYRQPPRSAFAISNMKLKSIDDLSRATLGEPYKVLNMRANGFDASSASTLIAQATFLYYEFPIVIDGQAHGVIDVMEKNGVWEPYGGGGKEDIYDLLIDTQTFRSRSLVHWGNDVIFALVEKKGQYYIVPTNKNSAAAFGVKQSCSMIPFKTAMQALASTNLMDEKTSTPH